MRKPRPIAPDFINRVFNKIHLTITRARLVALFVLIALASTAAFSTTSSASSIGKLWESSPLSPIASGLNSVKRAVFGTTTLTNTPVAVDPSVTTDKADYLPGQTVQISGSGFHANEEITLLVAHSDDTAEGGAGHDHFHATTDGEGNFTAQWLVDPDDSIRSAFKLTADCPDGLHAETTFTDGENLEGWANKTNTWSGTLAGGNSAYGENLFIPFRYTSPESDTNEHTATIRYDFRNKDGKFFVDYVGSYNETIKNVDVCQNLTCDPATLKTVVLPTDTSVTPLTQQGRTVASIQKQGVLTAYNVSAISIDTSGITTDTDAAGNQYRIYKVKYKASSVGANVVFAFGGHLAQEGDWGAGKGASSLPGGSSFVKARRGTGAFKNASVNTGSSGAISPSADLAITKSASATSIAPGAKLTYTLTVTNSGPNSATEVIVSDPLPSNTSFFSASSECTFDSVAKKVTCNLGAINVGSSKQVGIVVTVNADATGSVSNTATVAHSTTTNPVVVDFDASNNSATATTTVTQANRLPVANGDTYSTNEDIALTVNAPGVLGNDTDADSNPLTAVIVTIPNASEGTLTLDKVNSDGSFTFTPAANFNGTASFTYKANDGTADSAPATVTITVNSVNDAPTANSQSVTTDEDTAKVITLSGSDPENNSLTYTVVGQPQHGTVSGTGANKTYTPAANYSGTDSFTFKVNDGTADSQAATVSITINPVNDAPAAQNDAATTNEDTAVNINVLGNDSDVDGDTLSVSLPAQQPASSLAKGAVQVNADGMIAYTPNLNANGADSFTYGVSDGHGGTATATVSVTITPVNDAPTANAQSVTTNEDTAQPITLSGNDVDGDTLTYTVVTQPQHGALSGTAPNLTYTPNANYNGTDSFKFKVKDTSNAESNEATVNITIIAVNDAPVATTDAYSVDEDNTLNVTAALGVLANDSDVDGDAITAAQVSNPAHGSLTLNANGSFSYTPAANYNGSDSFTYKASDGSLDSGVTTVSITITAVTDAPTATADNHTVDEDNTLTVAANGVLGNDNDIDSASLSAVLVSNPSNAATNGFTLNTDGSFSYKPKADFNGSDSFTYKANDGSLDSNTVTVSITINPVNDDPKAANDAVSTDEDTPLTINVSDLLGNDTDVDGDSLSLSGVANVTGGKGSIANNNNDTLTFTPDLNANGAGSFTYSISDGNGGTATGTVQVTIRAVNDNPVAVNDTANTNEDTYVDVVVVANDTDVDNANADLRVAANSITGVSGGNATLLSDGRTVRFTPDLNANSVNTPGGFGFSYKVSDGQLTSSNSATVTIQVAAVNDAPVLTLSTASVTAQYSDPISVVTVTATDVDSVLNANSITLDTNLPNDLVLTPGATAGSATISGRLNVAAGTYSPKIKVSDGTLTDIKTLTVNVTKEDAEVVEFSPASFMVEGNDSDVDLLNLTLTVKEKDDGYLSNTLSSGGLVNAKPISVTLSPVAGGSPLNCSTSSATPSPAYVSGSSDTATVPCSTIANVPVNVYEVNATINGEYFTGIGVGAVTVMDPALGFTTGGGWFTVDNGATRVNFGFNAKILKSGQVQGSLLTIFRRPEGNFIVKSNAMGGLAISQSTDKTYWTATFTGKATYQVPAGMPLLYCGANKCGAYTFTTYVEDRKEPGAGLDRFWLQVKDPNNQLVGTVSLLSSAAANAVPITGGNIQVPQPQGK